LTPRKTCGILKREAIQPTKPNNKPKKNMFDSENPEGYNTQAESCPEFDAVRSTDDGFSCGGGEDDSLLEWMKKNGF
jgi:hypothetical protein